MIITFDMLRIVNIFEHIQIDCGHPGMLLGLEIHLKADKERDPTYKSLWGQLRDHSYIT